MSDSDRTSWYIDRTAPLPARTAILAVRYSALPHMECGGDGAYGFSIYRGIVVCWDEDHDTRILDFIDDLDIAYALLLVAVQEHEGSIAFRWKDRVPEAVTEGKVVTSRDGDYWTIAESCVVGQ